ncbi:MAG: protease inhibitor I42 family protein, partial [Actinobacteria bacterium]|nr:protease inhibitor I42 family protein [Actinomycetota bacterium]
LGATSGFGDCVDNCSRESIRVPQGETFEVALREPAATGHRWRLTDVPEDVALIRERYEPPRTGGPVGSARRRVITLRATDRGHYRLKFELGRPLEAEPAAEHHVELDAV